MARKPSRRKPATPRGTKRAPIKSKAKPRAKAKREAKPAAKPEPATPKSESLHIPADLLERILARGKRSRSEVPHLNPFQLPKFPPQAMPPEPVRMAMDALPGTAWASGEWAGSIYANVTAEGLFFPGYPYLAELAQRPEYRIMSETIADDATRKWIDFDVTGDENENRRRSERDPIGEQERRADPDERRKRLDRAGKTDKVKELKEDQKRLEVQDRFYTVARDDGFFGRMHLFIDTGADIDDRKGELATPIGDGTGDLSRSKIKQGSLRRLQTVEPVWAYPTTYNAMNPLRADWYRPTVWYVMGTEIHVSRLLPFIGHPVPDMLKPAYAFGGLSMSQMAKPYVDIWLQTRESIAALIHSFSVMVLMTDLATQLAPGAAGGLLNRVALFNLLRDNQGLMVVNKNSEDFKNVSAQLSGLHELQAQAQEHMSSVSRIPLVKFTGIQPAGLNASSEGEIKVYDDTMGAYQMRLLDPHLTKIIRFQQLSLWGEIDPEITHRWEPLRELTAKEIAEKQKQEADRDQVYVDLGALSPEEVRHRIVNDPELPFTALDPDEVPDLKQEEEEGLAPRGSGGAIRAELESGGETKQAA